VYEDDRQKAEFYLFRAYDKQRPRIEATVATYDADFRTPATHTQHSK